MPLLKRKPFTPEKPPPELKPSDEVFVCSHTNEVFTDYESFFKRTILCNSLVWSCQFSGKSNLTYHEALESEQEIIKQAESLSTPLQRAALTLVHHIQRGRLANLCDEVFSYLKDRYQEGEEVEVQHLGKKRKGKIQKVIEPEELTNGFENPLGSPKSRKSSTSSTKDKKVEKSTGTPSRIRKSSTVDKDTPVKSRKTSESSCKSPGKVKSPLEGTPGKSRKNSTKESLTSPKKLNDKETLSPKSKKLQKNASEKLKSPKSKTSPSEPHADVIIVEDDNELNGKQKDKKVESTLKSPKGKNASFWPDSKNYKYAVQLYPENIPKSKEEKKTCKEVITVEFSHVSRKKGCFTRDKLKNFLKLSCVRSTQQTDDGFYYVKVEYRKKFDLGEPMFEIPLALSSPPKGKSRKRKKSGVDDDKESSSHKKKKLGGEDGKEKSKKHKMKGDGKDKKTGSTLVKKLTPEEKLKLIEEERQKRRMMIEEDKEKRRVQREQERLEMKTKREEERAQKKIERDQEREKLREQKRQEALWLKEWSKPREDLELDDLKDLPQPQPVQVKISNELFGDAVMVLEFLNVFGSLFDIKDEFPSGLNYSMLEEGLAEQDAEGVFYDLLQFLLGAILRTHMEEEEDEGLETADAQTRIELDDEDYHRAKVSASAAMAAVWPILHQGKPLHELIMDPFTCTELLRLHLLSSGARVGCGDPEYRWHSRGGFTYSDDAGVEFRHREPYIMKALVTASVYDLSPEEKLKILTALCGQLMTYATSRDNIEDGFDRLKKARREWLSDQWAEQRREKEEAAARYRKRQEERIKQKEELEKKKKEKENEKSQEDGKPEAMETNAKDEEKAAEEPGPANQDSNKVKGKRKSGKDSEEKANESENKPATEESEKSVEDKDKQDEVQLLSKEEEEQIAMQKKIDRERREQDYLKEMRKAVSMSSIQPLGRDRIYRRYWMFKSLNGLFIEDDDPDLPKFLETIFEEENCEEEQQENNKEEKMEEKENQSAEKADKDENKPQESVVVEKDRGIQQSEKITGLKSVLKSDFDKMVKDGIMSESFNMEQKAKRSDVIAKYSNRDDITRWSFIAGIDDLESLVKALNPRGHRERMLREALQLDFKYLSKTVEKCPFKEENVVPKKVQKPRSRKQQAVDKSRFKNTEDFVEANLRDQILDLEDRLWQGGLGAIKVEDRVAWRAKVENDIYGHLRSVEVENKEEGVNGVKENEEKTETVGDVSMKEEEKKDETLVNGVNDKPIDEKVTIKEEKEPVLTNGDLDGSEMDTEPELVKVEESKESVSDKSVFKAIPPHMKLDLGGVRTSFSPPESRTGTPVISLAPNFEHTNPAVKELALALLKVEQGIESKYLSPPLGEDEETKRQKQKDAAALALTEFNEMMKAAVEGKDKKKKSKPEQNEKDVTETKSAVNEETEDGQTKEDDDDDRSSNSSKAKDPQKQKTCLERWEESLMACTSLSQVFVHLNTLDGSVTWSKSVLNARCRLCRRKGDAEKMLLCDACDRGHHMYCLKPPIKEIPEGNWFCPDCRPKETRRSERRRRAPRADDEDENEEQEELESDSESEEESDEESETEEESEEDEVSDADSEHVDNCAQCEQGGELLCCDVCPLAYHVDCAYPPLRRIPRGNWACQVCTGADEERPKKCRVKKSIIKAALRNAKEIEKQKSSRSSKAKKTKSNKRSSSPVTPKPRGRKESTDSGPKSSKRRKVQESLPSSSTTPTSATSASSKKNKRNIPASLRIKGRSSVDSSRSPSPARKTPTRRDPRVTGRLIKCGKLLDEVIGHADADFFTETISLSKFPNYNRNPTNLEIIKAKLKENAFDSVEDFISDVRKVFIDCAEHFRPRAKEARAGVRLSAFFETRSSEMGLDTSERSVRSCRRM